MAFGPLVGVDWLRTRLREPDLVLVDCRWRLGEPCAGLREYEAGHVPGAAFLEVDSDLAGPPDGGRHPLPDAAAFEHSAAGAGIGADSRVVAYDDAGEGGAARLWWLLRHFGHDAAAVLDGGMRAWLEAGAEVEAGGAGPPKPASAGPRSAAGADAPSPAPARPFRARPRSDDVATGDEIRERLRDERLVLLDARAGERYRGEVEPVDAVAGHIPGARNAPFAALAPGGRFRPPEELRALLAEAGADEGRELVAYCGSGVTSCTLLLAAEVAGFAGARLYPGSWSEWSSRGLPVETGG